MNSRLFRYVATMAFTGIVLVGAFVVAMYGSAAYAAPQQQEIPAVSVSRNTPTFATLFSGVVTTATGATTRGDAFDVTPYDGGEVQLVVDQTLVAGAPNTVTVELEYSNDRLNWSTATVITNVVVDANRWYTDIAVLGRYLRTKVTPTSVNPVTVTLSAVLEP